MDSKLLIPSEVLEDICQYLNPYRLHAVARYSDQSRWIVNTMARARYIERWLNSVTCDEYSIFNKSDTYLYAYNMNRHMRDSIEYAIYNKWYFRLQFGNETYPILLDILDMEGIRDKRIYICVCIIGRNICDVSGLGNVYTVELLYCHNIKNVDLLGNVHTLNLQGCEYIRVEDVCRLGNVYKLSLSGWSYIKDIDILDLGSVHTLDLSRCYLITDVSSLCGIHTLNLICNFNVDISMLGNVHTLSISGTTVTNISMLNNNYAINLYGIPHLSNIDAVGASHILDIGGNMLNIDISMLGSVNTLILDRSDIADISALGGVNTLNLSFCENITNKCIDVLASVDTVCIKYCKKISTPYVQYKLRNVRNLDIQPNFTNTPSYIGPGTYTYIYTDMYNYTYNNLRTNMYIYMYMVRDSVYTLIEKYKTYLQNII